MNILSETWTGELLRCLARDRKSTPKFHYTTWHQATMLMFSQELIWRGEICYANFVVSALILKMRSEDTFLEKWCISLPFHSVTLAIKADHEAAEHFVCHRGPLSKIPKNGYLCMLIDSEVYSIVTYLLTYLRITSSLPIVTLAHAQ